MFLFLVQKMEEVVLFYGRGPYHCFSQFYPAVFTVNGVTYTCAEQWMMAHKASLFPNNEALKAQILQEKSPYRIKALGRQVQHYNDTVWSAVRFSVVQAGNQHKFLQNPTLATILLNTATALLAEASATDLIWGIGLASDDPRAQSPKTWRGQNLLGQALMSVRAWLQEHDKNKTSTPTIH